MANMNANELNEQELEQTTGGVDMFPGEVGQTAIYTGNVAAVPVPTTPTFVLPQATLPVGGTSYTVVSGDTLGKIAKRYNTTVANLMALNPQIVDANKIYVGQVIRIS